MSLEYCSKNAKKKKKRSRSSAFSLTALTDVKAFPAV